MRAWGYGALALLLGVAPLVLPAYALLLLGEVLIWALLALSFNLLFGQLGLLSLGQSVFFGLGAYGVALALPHLGNQAAALAVGVAAALGGAALLGALAVRLRGHGFILLTAVGALLLYGTVTSPSFSAWTGGTTGLGAAWSASPEVRHWTVAGFALAALLGLRWLARTPLGLAWTLVRENERRAAELGYPPALLKWLAFVAAGGVAGLAGALFALFNGFVGPQQVSWTLSAEVAVWTLVGGVGTLWGPVLGAASFKLLQVVLSQWWPLGHPLVLGAALLLVVRFFPDGLLGAWRRRKQK